MLRYEVIFFDRTLSYVFHDFADNIVIDDDYISAKTNTIRISPTDAISSGNFVYLRNDLLTFLGVVTDVSPGEYETTVYYKPFISLFDDPIMSYVADQSTDGTSGNRSLEQVILSTFNTIYVNPEDTYQKLPISVSIDSAITQTTMWNLGLEPYAEGSNWGIVKLYTDLIVPALKKYGVAIKVVPSFSNKTIYMTITKSKEALNIDGNLNDVTIKTLKYTDRPTGTNKLIVYNANDLSQHVTFYVYTDRTWGLTNTDRITPVVREVVTVSPDSDYEDEATGFAVSALDTAYSYLSGLEWDNLIELETTLTNENIDPLSIEIGQKVILWYKGATYTSILTGRTIESQNITLLFGSERIEYSKRFRL